MPSLDLGFLMEDDFRSFFRFSFEFSREGTMKTIERDVIVSLLPLVIDSRSSFTDRFLSFLQADEGVNQYTHITKDQWDSFLLLSQRYETEERLLSEYTDEDACLLKADSQAQLPFSLSCCA